MALKSKGITPNKSYVKLIVLPALVSLILLFSGVIAVTYLVLFEKIQIDKMGWITNAIVFISTLGGLLPTQTVGDKKLYSIGVGIATMFLLYLIIDMLLLGGVSSQIWTRLLTMILAGATHVIGSLLKGDKRYRHKRVHC